MADVSADVLAADAAEDESGENDNQLLIQQVTKIVWGKRKPWFPEVQIVGGTPFVTFNKADTQLCYLVTGKGMNRHSCRETVSLQVEWWEEARKLRNSEFA